MVARSAERARGAAGRTRPTAQRSRDRRAGARRPRGRDHREGHARDGDLVRPPDRGDARRIPTSRRCTVARAWLGEHRASTGRLYQRLREIRGLNYGDYAYIEAFPRGMFQFFPDPERRAPRADLRDLDPAGRAGRTRTCRCGIALHELDKLIENGLTQEDFEATRDYLMKNVYLMTATQDQQLGYALDSRGTASASSPAFMRRALQSLTVEQVNAAIRRHLNVHDLSIVFITRDAAGLKQALVSDAASPFATTARNQQRCWPRDQAIGTLKLNIAADKITATPVAEVFAR